MATFKPMDLGSVRVIRMPTTYCHELEAWAKWLMEAGIFVVMQASPIVIS